MRHSLFQDLENLSDISAPGAIGDGWFVGSGLIGILYNGEGYGTAHTGNQFGDLDAGFAVNNLYQSLTTTPGGTYTISFWFSDDVGGNALTVNFGSTTLFSGTTTALGSGNYELLTYTAIATGPTTDLSFTSQYLFNGGGVGAVIDDVSVVSATPEPSSLVFLGSGVLGLAGVLRRRLIW